jgi:hypothetical protein
MNHSSSLIGSSVLSPPFFHSFGIGHIADVVTANSKGCAFTAATTSEPPQTVAQNVEQQ